MAGPFTGEHQLFRSTVRSFAEKELAPHADRWEEETFDDWVFPRMGELGFLGLSMPERYGGQGGDYYCNLVLTEEIGRANCGGLGMGLAVHTDMVMPPLLAFGTEEQKQRYLAPAIRGELIACLDEDSFKCDVGSGWTVSTLLCHLAFWDQRALFLLRQWQTG